MTEGSGIGSEREAFFGGAEDPNAREAAGISEEIVQGGDATPGESFAPQVEMKRKMGKRELQALGAGALLTATVLGGAVFTANHGENAEAAMSDRAVEQTVDDGEAIVEDEAGVSEAGLDAETSVGDESSLSQAEQETVANFLNADFRAEARDVENGLTGDFESYDVEGGWGDQDKTDPYAEAYVKDVLYNLFGITKESDATDLQVKQALYYIDTHQALSAGQTAIDAHIDGFDGLTPDEAEQKILAMNTAEREDLQDQLALFYAEADLSREDIGGEVAINMGIGRTAEGEYYATRSEHEMPQGTTVYRLVRTVDEEGHSTFYTSVRKTPCANHQNEALQFKIVEEHVVDQSTERHETPDTPVHVTPEVPAVPVTPDTPAPENPDTPTPETPDTPDTPTPETPETPETPDPEPDTPTPEPEPEPTPEPEPEPTPTPEPEPEPSDAKTPFEQEKVDQGGTGHITPLDVDESAVEKEYNPETQMNPEASNPVEYSSDGSEQVGADTDATRYAERQEVIQAADDSYAMDRISDATPDYSAGEAAQAEANQSFEESGSAAAVQDTLNTIQENGGQTVTGENGGPTAEQSNLAENFDELFGR